MASKTSKVLWAFLIVPILATPLFGQNDSFVNRYNSTGVESFRAYSGLQENINLYNDNLNIVIPLFTLKGRNGSDLPVVARYNSKLQEWVFHQDEFGGSWWTYELIPGLQYIADQYFDVQLLPSWQYFGMPCAGPPGFVPNVWVFTEVDGTRHELFNRDFGEAVPCDIQLTDEVMHSLDSSHMRLSEGGSTQWVYFKNGTFEYSLGVLFDTNGNGISSYWDAATSTQTLIDTLGRSVEKRFNAAANDYEIRVRDADGTQRTYRLTATELIFPDATGAANGLRYRFEWQQFGPLQDPDGFTTSFYESELVKITHPTNGYTRYTWQLRASRKGPTRLIGKYVNADDGQVEAFWEYNTELPGYAQVKGPDGSYTRHYFDGFGREDVTEFWSAAGTLRKQLRRIWSALVENPRVLTETTVLEPNGANLQGKVEYSYDSDGYGGRTNGNITEVREYGFGTGAPGGLVRRTTRSYLVNPTYETLHILDRKTQEIVYDGGGTQKARTDYFYDDYTAPRTLLDTPGAVQRDSARGTSYTTRGNVTRISRWLNTTGGFLNTYFRYDICGNIREETDPRGFTSKTHYNEAYQYAYPYALEDPKGFTTNRDYDFNNTSKNGFGYLTRAVDINGNTTTYSYDRLGRNKVVGYPDGGLIETFYSDLSLLATHRGVAVFQNQASSLPLRRKVYSKIQDSPYLEKVELSVFDGFERDFMGSMSNNSQMDWTRTEYDGHSRVKRTSNPISLSNTIEIPIATSFSGWTSYQYDALNRITQMTTQDGQSVTSTYDANVTTVTDQAGNSRQSEYDALGRLTIAREPNPATGDFGTGYTCPSGKHA